MNKLFTSLAVASCLLATVPALAASRSGFSTTVPTKVSLAAKRAVKPSLGPDVRISGAKFTKNWTLQAINPAKQVVVLKVSPGGKVLDSTTAMSKSSMGNLDSYQSGGSDAL